MPQPYSPHAVSVRLNTADIRGLLDRIDYQDTFGCDLPPDGPELHVMARAIFGTSPGIVRTMMRLRDMLVGPLGLKTASGINASSPEPSSPPEIGQRIGLFTLRAMDDRTLLFMERDRHLDFVVRLRRSDAEGQPARAQLHLSTCVQFHNAFGRAYFAVVRPFHARIVARCLRDGMTKAFKAMP